MRFLFIILTSTLAVSVIAQPTAREWDAAVTAGWNLGNQLECPASGQNNESVAISNPTNAINAETAWGNPRVTEQKILAVKAAGFNAIRIPVRWQHHITDEATMTIDESWLNRVKEVVGYCLDNDMYVIINTHHDQWLESRPLYSYQTENNNRLSLLWTNIATAFRDYDYRLAFAGTNEVHMPNNWNTPTTENQTVQNSYNQTFVNAVRATGGNNLKRHLVVQTYVCNLDYGLRSNGFVVPADIEGNGNSYMSVEFHYYTPWDFCMGATAYYWGTAYKGYSRVSSSNEQNLRSDLQRAATAWGEKGLGIIIGEWGVTDHWDKAVNQTSIHGCRTYYCNTLVTEARQRGIATFIWDNNAFGNGEEKYGIFDRHDEMRIRASWIVNGIQNAVTAGISPLSTSTQNAVGTSARLVLEKGRVVIVKGEKRYHLNGNRFKN